MAIRVTCDSCDHEFTTRDENAGRRIRCPECSEPVAVSAKRKGKSKKSSSGNQTVVMAAIAGGVVAVIAVITGVALMNGGNNAVPVGVNVPTNVGAAPQTNLPNVGGPVGLMPSVSNSSVTSGTPMPSTTPPGVAVAGAPNSSSLVPGNTTSPTPTTTGFPSGVTPPANGLPQPGSTPSPIPGSPMPVANNVPGSLPPAAGANAGRPAATSAAGTEMNLADLIERCEPSVVRIDVQTAEGGGNGSGFVIDKTGIIITNYHVIAGARTAVCAFRDGTQSKVEGFLKIDTLRDVAIIKVNHPADKLHPIPLATILPRKGEKVVAFGAPLGLSWTATDGVVSAFRTKPELANLGIDGIEGDWIQTSTPISPGNSGGPLVNFRGEVVAMNTMQLTIGQNLNFAVQAKEIDLVLNQSKASTLVALAPAALPKVEKSRAPKIIDATKDDRGRKALGRLKEVTLLTVMSRDPTGRIRAVVTKRAIDTVRQLGLLVRDGDESDNELMIVTMHFEDNPNSKTGAFEVHVTAVVLMRDRNEKGDVEVLKVWEKEEKLGSLADRLFFSGELSKQVMDKLGSFFGKFKGSFHTAHREADKAAAPIGDKSKTPKSK